jgi:hypothetical protein
MARYSLNRLFRRASSKKQGQNRKDGNADEDNDSLPPLNNLGKMPLESKFFWENFFHLWKKNTLIYLFFEK